MKHLILIGFKHSGKSSIGKVLAKQLGREFVDLDDTVVDIHRRETKKTCTPREIMLQLGEAFFRSLEHDALLEVLSSKTPIILAVGGGTPMPLPQRELLREHDMVHVSAPKSVIFERIMTQGWPAFFPKDVDAFEFFEKLWAERQPVFAELSSVNIDNGRSVEEAVAEIVEHLQTCGDSDHDHGTHNKNRA